MEPPEPPSNKHAAPRWMLYHLLALDAPFLALLWMAMMGRVHALRNLPVWDYVGLFGAVWLVYLGDRLIDSRNPENTARHQFAARHRKFFAICFGLTAIALAWVGYFKIARALVTQAALVGGGVVCYFLLVAKRQQTKSQSGGLDGAFAALVVGAIVALFPGTTLPGQVCKAWFLLCGMAAMWQTINPTVKAPPGAGLDLLRHISCGMLFAIGVSLPAMFRILEPEYELLPPLMLLFSLNCIAIGHWEKSAEAQRQQFGKITSQLIWAGLTIGAFFAGLLVAQHSALWNGYAASLLIGFTGLALLHFLRRRLSPQFLSLLADASLLGPLLFVFARNWHQ